MKEELKTPNATTVALAAVGLFTIVAALCVVEIALACKKGGDHV
jgi:hypothetical protein